MPIFGINMNEVTHPKTRMRCTQCDHDKFYVFVGQTADSGVEYVCCECKNHQDLMIQ